jgi:hypothetical protein
MEVPDAFKTRTRLKRFRKSNEEAGEHETSTNSEFDGISSGSNLRRFTAVRGRRMALNFPD